jgi:ubiquinone/menaquinone biosynthesis C-methylase UbiE
MSGSDILSVPAQAGSPPVLDFLRILCGQWAVRSQMARVPEPHELIERYEEVHQYNRVMSSRILLVYALLLELIERCRDERAKGPALDLACGPGYMTLCLARHLDYERVTGLDLSEPMLETASSNALALKLGDRASFEKGDVTKLSRFRSGQFALTQFSNGAHHLPSLETVGEVLEEMDRITRPDGLVVVLDPVRLKSRKLTELYLRAVGRDYAAKGLPQFYETFENSMYAAWTVEEMRSVVPKASERTWCQIVPWGIPATQVIVGLPKGSSTLYRRRSSPAGDRLIPKEMSFEWRWLRRSFFRWGKRYWKRGRHD